MLDGALSSETKAHAANTCCKHRVEQGGASCEGVIGSQKQDNSSLAVSSNHWYDEEAKDNIKD